MEEEKVLMITTSKTWYNGVEGIFPLSTTPLL
jgi:hypothetical protein